jgi:hypothetical protein
LNLALQLLGAGVLARFEALERRWDLPDRDPPATGPTAEGLGLTDEFNDRLGTQTVADLVVRKLVPTGVTASHDPGVVTRNRCVLRQAAVLW